MNASAILSATILVLTALHLQAQEFLTNGLVAYYPFNGSANDQSGNGNDAVASGDFFYVSNGLHQSALHIVGDRQLSYSGGGHVVLPDFGAAFGNGWTCNLWAKDEAIGGYPAQDECYVSFQTTNDAVSISMSFGSGSWNTVPFPNLKYGVFWADGNTNCRVQIDTNTYSADWKMLTMTYEEGVFQCFLNGTLIHVGTTSRSPFPAANAYLGFHSWTTDSSARMDCTVDDVRIYTRALSDTEVTTLYTIEAPTRLSISVSQVRLCWPAAPDVTYQVQYRSALTTNMWVNLGSPVVGTGTNVCIVDEVSGPQRFYRVEIVE